MKPVKPWTNAEGKKLSTEELKTVSMNWSPEIWEAYLSSLEYEEPGIVFLPKKGVTIEETATEDFRMLSAEPNPLKPALRADVRVAVESLSKRKKEIIKNTYWNALSERDQALSSNVGKTAIHQQKARAKKQIKNFLLKNSGHLRAWKRRK